MPDEATEALQEQENPTTQEEAETSQEETTSEPDYRSQYEELRSKFNERDTEISEARQLKELAKELGYSPSELAEAIRESQQEPEEQETEYEDPGEAARKEVAELKAQLKAEREQAQLEDAFMDAVEDLERSEGLKFPKSFTRHMWREGLEHGRLPEDVFKEDFGEIFEAGSAWNQTRKERETEAKRKAAKAPSGSAGSRQEDLSDRDTRRSAMEREINSALDSLGPS